MTQITDEQLVEGLRARGLEVVAERVQTLISQPGGDLFEQALAAKYGPKSDPKKEQ